MVQKKRTPGQRTRRLLWNRARKSGQLKAALQNRQYTKILLGAAKGKMVFRGPKKGETVLVKIPEEVLKHFLVSPHTTEKILRPWVDEFLLMGKEYREGRLTKRIFESQSERKIRFILESLRFLHGTEQPKDSFESRLAETSMKIRRRI